MKKERASGRYGWADAVLESPVGCFIMAAVAIFMGVVFIVTQSDNKPVTREEAIAYSGEFKNYESGKNYSGISFEDGVYIDVYPHTETQDFIDKMRSLPKGTMLYILVNPNNDYAAEIKTDTLVLLDFEKSQQEIADYDNGYVAIGVFVLIGGAFFIIYGISNYYNKKDEHSRRKKKKPNGPMRYADNTEKNRILLEVKWQSYNICYRRIKHKNELVINGRVYDEKKGIIEFAHRLTANIDGHTITAGLSNEKFSYIRVNGREIASKKRYF